MWEQRGKALVLKEMRDRWRCCGVFLSVAPFCFTDGRSGGEVVLAARRATASGGARPAAVATVAAEEIGEGDDWSGWMETKGLSWVFLWLKRVREKVSERERGGL